MTMKELVAANRSYRIFDQSKPVSLSELESLVDLARQSGSAANLQPLRFMICADSEMNAAVFDTLAWAAYYKDWKGPEEGQRPTGYIVILADERHSKTSDWDMGIAAQSMLLGAAELGYGGCMIGNIKREQLAGLLGVPEGFAIKLVIALGVPAEKCVIDTIAEDGDVKYWRDENGVHHVPKRALKDIILARHGR